MILFSDWGCPFAHRIEAWVAHLGVELEHRRKGLGDPFPELEACGGGHRIPSLLCEDLLLFESAVIVDYLIERSERPVPEAPSPEGRAVERLARLTFDAELVPRLFASDAELDAEGRVVGAPLGDRSFEVLERLELCCVGSRPVVSRLSLHLAPMWLRFRWWRPHDRLTRLLLEDARWRALGEWLEAAAALPCVRVTSPTAEMQRDVLRRGRALGVLPA